MPTKTHQRSPTSVDVHVGSRLRMLRVQRGLSQVDLARELGLTFQQVQKYEHGTNRISCSRLYALHTFFKVPYAYFFGGLEQAEETDTNTIDLVHKFMHTSKGVELMQNFVKITSAVARVNVVAVVEDLANVYGRKC